MNVLYPIELEPAYKDYLWGGTRLEELYGKKSGLSITAESWELSCYRDGLCRIKYGYYAGHTLAEVVGVVDDFPIIVKFIDAQKDLSIQVHPSDETANLERDEHGKAELWYIVDCEPQSYIYYGFSQKLSKEQFLDIAQDGSICQYLNKVPVQKGDVFYIQPGTVHALGAGILVAEIQQSSNTTFRIYDYLRRGADGKLRPLHLERAAQVVNLEPVVPEECRVNRQAQFREFSLAEMFRCRYFEAYQVDVHKRATLTTGESTFHHLLFVGGSGSIEYHGEQYAFAGGSSYFLPGGLGEYTIRGRCRALLSCT